MAQPTAEQDARTLYEATVKDDKKAIIDVLAHRNSQQRVAIRHKYKEAYVKELDEMIPQSKEKFMIWCNFRRTVSALLKTPTELLVDELHNSLKGSSADEGAVIEILCTREPGEIKKLKEEYKKKYKTDLENDIREETSKTVGRVLVEVAKADHSASAGTTAHEDARDLYQAGEAQWGRNEEWFIKILTNRPFQKIRDIYDEYSKIPGQNLCEALESELGGNLEKSLVTIVKSARCTASYYAERIHDCVGWLGGTDHRSLIRLIVSRCEIDMPEICAEFGSKHGKKIIDYVKEYTSGSYGDLLAALVEAHCPTCKK